MPRVKRATCPLPWLKPRTNPPNRTGSSPAACVGFSKVTRRYTHARELAKRNAVRSVEARIIGAAVQGVREAK